LIEDRYHKAKLTTHIQPLAAIVLCDESEVIFDVNVDLSKATLQFSKQIPALATEWLTAYTPQLSKNLAFYQSIFLLEPSEFTFACTLRFGESSSI
jgi:hypothetical protein